MSAAKFSYDEIIPRALSAIPEIKAAYEAESAKWPPGEKFGPYNFFDIVLMPHIRQLLHSEGHCLELQRAFNFFETLISHSEQELRDVVAVGVCEDLASDELALQRACRFMGPKTKESCDAYLK